MAALWILYPSRFQTLWFFDCLLIEMSTPASRATRLGVRRSRRRTRRRSCSPTPAATGKYLAITRKTFGCPLHQNKCIHLVGGGIYLALGFIFQLHTMHFFDPIVKLYHFAYHIPQENAPKPVSFHWIMLWIVNFDMIKCNKLVEKPPLVLDGLILRVHWEMNALQTKCFSVLQCKIQLNSGNLYKFGSKWTLPKQNSAQI